MIWNDPAEPDDNLDGDGGDFPPGFGPNSRGDDVAVFGEEATNQFFAKTGCTHLVTTFLFIFQYLILLLLHGLI